MQYCVQCHDSFEAECGEFRGVYFTCYFCLKPALRRYLQQAIWESRYAA